MSSRTFGGGCCPGGWHIQFPLKLRLAATSNQSPLDPHRFTVFLLVRNIKSHIPMIGGDFRIMKRR